MDLAKIKGFFLRDLEKSLSFVLNGGLKPYDKNLTEAMRYALLGKGKRLRPMLVFLAAKAQSPDESDDSLYKKALPAALAVEYVHGFSLVHDDLPAMDDDTYRRGKFSLHVQFDEALAILAGDALLIEAFNILSYAPVDPITQIRKLSLAAGRQGLILGQVADLATQGLKDVPVLYRVNLFKTAKLFSLSLALGAISVGGKKEHVVELESLGLYLGELFQLRDDLCDRSGLYGLLGEKGLVESIDGLVLRITNRFKEEKYKEIFNIFNV